MFFDNTWIGRAVTRTNCIRKNAFGPVGSRVGTAVGVAGAGFGTLVAVAAIKKTPVTVIAVAPAVAVVAGAVAVVETAFWLFGNDLITVAEDRVARQQKLGERLLENSEELVAFAHVMGVTNCEARQMAHALTAGPRPKMDEENDAAVA